MNALVKRSAWAVLLLLGSSWAGAQDLEAELVQAVQLHQDGEWEAATQELNRLLESGQLSKSQRTRARQALAEAYVLLKQSDQAVGVYKQIVREDRSFNMRSLGEEPEARLVRPFGQAVLEVREEELRALEAQYSRVRRRAAFLRSAILPGWGQRYQGYRGRGYVMLGMTGGSLVYAVLARRWHEEARDTYRKAPRGADFDRLYDDYTSKTDRANLALGMAGAVWFVNVLDAVLQGPAVPSRPQHLSLDWQTPAHGPQVALIRRF